MESNDQAALRADEGVAFQTSTLFAHKSIFETVTVGPTRGAARGAPKQRNGRRHRLSVWAVPSGAEKMPAQLSGGQQQCRAMARALAMNPKALPGDAATTVLNSEMIIEVLDVMVQFSSEGMTMIVATNEWEFARKAADRVALVADDEIVQERKPEESFTKPRSDRARDALSKLFMT